MLSTGQLKVFASCKTWLEEFRLYRRDLKGRVVKQNDHLMDATRYAIVSGATWLTQEPVTQERPMSKYMFGHTDPSGWMH